MRKVLLVMGVSILLLVALVVGVVWKFGPGWYAKFAAKGEKEYASKVWTEKVTLEDRIEVQVPFALKTQGRGSASQWIKNSEHFKAVGGRLVVSAAYSAYLPGAVVDLRWFADSLFDGIRKKKGVRNLEFVENKTEILGVPAYDFEIRGIEGQKPFRNHLLVFNKGSSSYLIGVDAPPSDDVPIIWKRMKESVRWVGPQDASPAKAAPAGQPRKKGPVLPPGMKRIE